MKKKYLDRRSAHALLKGRSFAAGAVIVFLTLILLLLRLVAPGFLITLAIPFTWTGGAISDRVHVFFSGMETQTALVRERDALLQKISMLEAENRKNSEELTDMKRLLGERHTASAGVLASVIMRPPVAPYDLFVIDAGSADGIALGSLMLGAGGIPLGTIESVTERTARGVLFSAPGRTTEGWAGKNRIPLTLMGAGAGTFSAVASKELLLSEGDSIIIPGHGSMPIGTIHAISADPSSPLVDLLIKPFINPFSTTWVTVVPTL